MAEPNPSEVAPWYLRNINQALALNETTGEVYVRTGITGDVYITGPVTIPGTVTVNSSPEDPVHVHVNEVGTSGTLTIPNMPVSIQDAAGHANSNTYPVYVSGSVNIGTMPEVEIKNDTGNPVPVSGSVNIGTMPEVEIKNDSGNPVPVSGTITANQGTNPWVVSGSVNATLTGNPVVALSSTQTDAFGRLRVSNPVTLFDTQARYYDHEQFSSSTAGGGAVVYNANASTFSLNVGTANGDSVIRETNKVFPYQPGKSLLVMTTFSMALPKANCRQRVGFFGTQNGIFFEVDGTTKNLVIRSYTGGIVSEDRVPQSSWNGDRLNGAGGSVNPSGLTLYPEYDQIFWMDIEWLGVGSVRCGFVINGVFYLCHTFHHANLVGNTTTYMTTATLPVRYEITNTGVTSGVGTLTQICASVISEGGYTLSGEPNGIGHDLASTIVLPNDQSFVPLIAIRLKSVNPDAVVLPVDFSIVPVDQAIVKYRVYNRAVTSGGSWVSAGSHSSVEYNLSPTALVSGNVNYSSFLISNNQSINTPQNQLFDFTEQLQRNSFTSTMYEYVITAATTGTNIDIYASVNWQEIS